MKYIQQNIKAIILGLVIAGGVSYAGAAGVFTGPECAPPNCNTDAPINVGVDTQAKAGRLSVGSGNLITPAEILTNLALKVSGTIQSGGALFTGPIAIADSSKGEGKVLVSDAAGLANWRDPASLGIGGSSTTHGFIQLFGSGQFTVPANINTIQVEVIGGGASGAYHGGMGGGYAMSLLNVTPGQEFSYSIGGGGAASCNVGNSGGNSTFGSIIAYGGLGTGSSGYTFPLSSTAGGFSGSNIGARGHSYLTLGYPGENTDKVAGYASGFPLSRGGGGATNISQTQAGVLPTYGGGGNGDSDSGGGGYCGGAGASGAILVRY